MCPPITLNKLEQVVIVFPVYHFSSFICLQKFVMFADKKSEPTKDCGLSSLIAASDFILLALHIKKSAFENV
jgi:hypothetical protein